MIRFKLLTDTAKLPSRGTQHSAGLDLCADEDAVVFSNFVGEVCKIKTGISIELEPGYEASVRGRSGLTLKGLIVHLGTIDADYRGEISVMCSNLTGQPISINKGDRIAQLVVARFDDSQPVVTDELSITERGANGFGSTGK